MRSPTLDRIARQGLQVVDAISPAPLTLPSHTTMLTGLLPPEHGVRENGLYTLSDSIPTLPRLLDARLETGAFVGAFPLAKRFGLAPGFDRYDDALPRSPAPGRSPERTARDVFAAATAWLDSTRTSRPFAFLHAFDPHYPYEPGPPWLGLARDGTMASQYEAEIASADRELARFLRGAGAFDADRATTILFTADHGEALGSHQEITHSIFIYDATQRVPLLLAGPGVSPGLETRQRSTVDVAPTILALYGVETPASWRGSPIGEAPREQEAYLENLSPELSRGWSSLFGLRTSRWKYIRAPRRELYDLEADPAETRNLLDEEPARADEMETTLANLLAAAERPAPAPEADEETLNQLRSLGYVTTIRPGTSTSKKLDPKDGVEGAAVLFHGQQAYMDADFSRAETLLRRAIQLDPTTKEGHSYLAGTYFGLRRHELCIEYARRALELEPHLNEGPIHMTIGEAYLALARPNEAVAPLEEAVRLIPRSEKARDLLARARAATR